MKRMNAGKILLMLFLFFTTQFSLAQNEAINSEKYCQQLMVKAKAAIENSDYLLSMKYFTEAEDLATKNHWEEKLFFIKNGIGAIYARLSNYGEAIGYYHKAVDIANNLKNNNNLLSRELLSQVYNNIGVLYANKKDYKNALIYYDKSFPLSYNDNKVLLGINMADLYIKSGKPEEAQKYLSEIKTLPMSKRLEQGWRLNYAETLLMKGQASNSKVMMEQLLKEADPNDDIVYIGVVKLLSNIYARQGDLLKAIALAKKGIISTEEMKEKVELYDLLYGLHFKNKQYVESGKYKDSLIIAKDSLTSLINNGLFESNKVKLKIQEYQNELVVNQERQLVERKLYITGTVFSLLLFLFIYRGLRNKIIKQRQKEELAENKQRIVDLEFENLKNNISEKNRKLSAKALYLAGRNELIEEVLDSLSKIPEISKKKQVADYMRTLKSYIRKDDEWDDFIIYFEQVNPAFIKAITEKYPELNSADIRFLCYVYMNLDLQEIANIFSITYNAAQKRQRRIKEKMQIDKEMPLYEYLVQSF